MKNPWIIILVLALVVLGYFAWTSYQKQKQDAALQSQLAGQKPSNVSTIGDIIKNLSSILGNLKGSEESGPQYE